MEKKMYLVFYAVSNSINLYRRELDGMTMSEAKEVLSKLNDDEWRVYEICVGYQNKLPSLSDFMEDYNNEELDGGWWVAILSD